MRGHVIAGMGALMNVGDVGFQLYHNFICARVITETLSPDLTCEFLARALCEGEDAGYMNTHR